MTGKHRNWHKAWRREGDRLVHISGAVFVIKRGERIAQMVIAPVTRAALVQVEMLDETQRVDHCLPEMAGSGFADATLRQVMDMTTGIDYTENYADPQAEIWNHMRAGGVMP